MTPDNFCFKEYVVDAFKKLSDIFTVKITTKSKPNNF